MNRQPAKNGRSKLDLIIIGLLIAGVLVSITLETIGLAIFCRSHACLVVSTEPTVFIRGKNPGLLIHNLADMINKHGIDIFLMELGIIVLIATPFVRVLVSMVYFAFERDVKFFLITFFVFTVLSISLALH